MILVVGPLPSLVCQAGGCDAAIPAIVGVVVLIILIVLDVRSRLQR